MESSSALENVLKWNPAVLGNVFKWNPAVSKWALPVLVWYWCIYCHITNTEDKIYHESHILQKSIETCLCSYLEQAAIVEHLGEKSPFTAGKLHQS